MRPFDCVGTNELTTPHVHRSEDDSRLRALCGTKTLPLTEIQRQQTKSALTMGDIVHATGYEPCIECNVALHKMKDH